jgi:formate dehydrogenase assembly factor FdhD
MFNLEQQGVPVAVIKNDNSKKKQSQYIFLDNNKNDDIRHPLTHIKAKKNESFQPITNFTSERTVSYITGQSGCGKSYFCANYILEYIKIHPKRNIYIFSSLTSDDTLDKIKKIKRIDIKNPEFIEEDISELIEELKNSLVVFDDTDCLPDKKIKNKVDSILNNCLQIGRHHSIDILVTSHMPCNGASTRIVLMEAHNIVFFPSSLGARTLTYLLYNYLGLDKKQIETIKKLDSRWVCICKSYPQILITENEIMMVKDI